MAATATYGYTREQLAAGVVGAMVDLLAKGLATLVIGLYRVELNEDVAHWFTEQEQNLGARLLLSARLRRLNRDEAYARAVGGQEYAAATAMIETATTSPEPGPRPTGQPIPAPQPTPAPVIVQAPAAPAEPPAPAAAVPAPQASAPAPAAPAPAPAAPAPEGAGLAAVQGMTPSIASTVRTVLATDPDISEADLIERVKEVHGDGPKLADTVRRSRTRALGKRNAS
jgi:hypothetical protein